MKLDIGGLTGQNKDFISVNIYQPCDIVHDLNKFPWPFKTSSVSEVIMNHTLEHLDNPLKVMEEIYRICKPNAIVRIGVPYWKRDFAAHPWHKHVFKPKWFKILCENISRLSIMYRKQKEWRPFNFKLVSLKYLIGKYKIWKSYTLYATLKVIKEKEAEIP